MAEERDSPKAIDVSALGNYTETVDVDPTANAFARSKPLHDAQYRAVACAPSNPEERKNMVRVGTFKKGPNVGHNYFLVSAEIKINEYLDASRNHDELQGKTRTFKKTFSSVQQSKDGQHGGKTSEIATALLAMGYTIAGTVSAATLVKTLVDALNANTAVGVETEQRGSYETDKKRAGSDDNQWKTVIYGEKNFPKDPVLGGHLAEATVEGHTVFARAEIVGYFRLP